MVKMEDAVIARYEHATERFELLVDPDLALKMRKGEQVSLNDLLAFDVVYKDAKKGEQASPESLKKVFQTEELQLIVKRIIEHGDVQLTTEQRKAFMEQKKKEIISFIATNAVNPQTKTPHPPQRIETAMEEAKVHIDPMKSAKEQINGIVESLKRLIPISMEHLQLVVKVPAAHAAKASSILHRFTLKKEEWQNDGSVIAIIDIPAGMKQDLLNQLNHITHGDMESKLLDEENK